MEKSTLNRFFSVRDMYLKLYNRLKKALISGKFWRYTPRKRKMLFNRLSRFEKKASIVKYSIPAVSTLLLLISREGRSEHTRMAPDRILRPSEKRAFEELDNTTVSYYDKIGTRVAIISGGGGAPYSLNGNNVQNRFFTIRNGNELILNANLSKLDRTTFDVDIVDTNLNAVTTPTITVIDVPSNATAAADIAFKPANQTLRAGSESKRGEAADIDNDGDLDLVILQDTAFTIYYNDGLGYFETIRDFNTLGGTFYNNTSFALGDVDGDDDLDILITGNFGSPAEPYPLFLNTGGDFVSSPFPVGFFDGEAQFADLDRDGDLDILRFTAYGGSDIYENDGTGTFSVSATNPAISFQRRIFGLNDLDGDLFIDVITGQSGPAGIQTFTGQGLPVGAAAFSNNGYIFQYLNDYDAVDADIDGDGDQDIIVSGRGIDPTSDAIFTNDGTGVFTGNLNPFATDSYNKKVADFDGDGDLDVFSLESDNGYGYIWNIWSNDGGLSFSQPLSINENNYDLQDLIVADFDGDGDVDAVTINNFGTANRIFFNEENFPITSLSLSGNVVSRRSAKGTEVGQFTPVQGDSDPITYQFIADAVNGVDNGLFTISSSGQLLVNADLSNLNKSALSIQVQAQDGFGGNLTQTFSLTLEDLPQTRPSSTFTARSFGFTNGTFNNIQLDDLDGDNDIDLVAQKSDTVFTFFNDGVGNFTPRDTLAIGFSNGDIRTIDVGDIDNDGDADIVALNTLNNSDYNGIFINDGLSFSDLSFGAFAPGVKGQKLADFDLDGDLDLFIFANGYSRIYYNESGTFFGAPGDFSADNPDYASKIELVDFDKDGDLDVAYRGRSGFNDYVRVLQTALGTIEGPPEFLRGTGTNLFYAADAQDFDVADFDGDGFEDIITDDSLFLFNDATQAFESVNQNLKVAAGKSAGSAAYDEIIIGDYDGDGDVDAMLDDGSGNFFTLENDGTGTFSLASPQPFSLESFTTQKVLWEDLDNDNDLDAFVHNGNSQADTILFNTSPLTFTANTFSLTQGTSFTLTAAELVPTDADTPPENIIYSLNTVPANGNLELAGTPLAASQTFTQADVLAGNVAYVHNGSSTTTDIFEFDASDGFTTLSNQSLNINITGVPVEDANNAIALDEGTTATITSTDLSYSDSDNTEGETTYNVTVPPVSGQLELTSNPGTAVTTWTQQDITNGLLTYIHDGSETTEDSFSFEVTDGSEVTGPAVFSFVINPVDDAPVLETNAGFTVDLAGSFTISSAELNATDADNTAAEISYTLISEVARGELLLSGSPLSASGIFTQADVDNGLVQFNHDSTFLPTAQLDLRLDDGGANINFIVSINVISGPIPVTTATPAVNENDTLVFTTTELEYAAVDNTPAEIVYTVTTAPAEGTLELSDNPGVAVTSWTQQNIIDGLLEYIHNGSETTSDSFEFEVTDGTTTVAGSAPYSVTVNPVNDPPVLVTNTGFSLDAGQTFTISTTELNASDVDNTPAELSFLVTSPPANGQLELTSAPGNAISQFTLQQVIDNAVIYAHNASSTTSDSFSLEVSDGTDTTSIETVSIIINSVEPPTLTLNEASTSEGGSVVLSRTEVNAEDTDTDSTALTFTVVTAPVHGRLETSLAAGAAISSFTQEDIDNGLISYVHDGTENFADSVELNLSDGINDLTGQRLSFSIAPVNDNTPVIDPAGPFAISEGVNAGPGTGVLVGTPITFTDADDAAATYEYTYNIEETTVPFAIDNDGQITAIGALDFGTQSSYTLNITVNDGANTSAPEPVLINIIKDQLSADSTMLVNIYETNNGVEWPNQQGWLTGDLITWQGVTISGDDVIALDLSNNNLEGVFDIAGDGLDSLSSLDISGNKLEDVIGIESKGLIQTVDVSDNSLEFAALTDAISGPYEIIYSPQKAALLTLDTLLQVGTDFVVDRTIELGDSYTWTRSGEAIDQTGSSFTISINDFSDEAEYVAEVTSTSVPDLTLTTQPVNVKVSSLERDSASLRVVYENLGFDVEGVNLEDYPGIRIENSRVTRVEIPSSGASGPLDEAINDVGGLLTVDLSDNNIDVLPVLRSSLSEVGSFKVSLNDLDFGDLLPNAGFTALDVSGGMNPFGTPVDTIIDQGTDIVLSFAPEGTNNEYRWQKDEVFLQEGVASTSFEIQNIAFEDMGRYRLTVTNPAFEGLTLFSEPQRVRAKTTIAVTPFYAEGAVLDVEDATLELYRDDSGPGPYVAIDTIGFERQNATFTFQDVVLNNNYTIVARPSDTLITKTVDGSEVELKLLSTWLGDDIDWANSEKFDLRVPYDTAITLENNNTEALTGTGKLNMTVESDFDEDQGDATERIEARRRVRKASCSLRRASRGGGGRVDQGGAEFVLVAVKETDDEGNVSFGQLPEGLYRINIQYPGVPMDETSQIEFEIAEGEEGSTFEASATITEDGIAVEIEKILGIIRKYFKDLVIYPNPADELFTLQYKRLLSDQVRMKMVSLTGQDLLDLEVKGGYDHSLEVDTKDLDEGIYLLYFYDEEEGQKPILTYKVIVQH